jgi:diguanylate cyclase (GGDEF)-like protein
VTCGRQVLLIDDDAALRAGMAQVLTGAGHRVLQAGSAAEARALLAREEPDLVVVDGLLPDASGPELIVELKRTLPGAHFLFVSAFFKDLKTFTLLKQELQVSGVMYKPFPLSELAIRVDEVLGIESGEASFVAGFDQLRASYLDALPALVDQLGRQLDDAHAGSLDALTQARSISHRLRGTAGSYGFPAVSEHAARLEDQLLRLSPPLGEVSWRALSQLLVALRSAARPPDSTAPSQFASTVLVVDDDRDFLALVTRAAREKLIRVVAAENRAEALERAKMEKLDAALIDVKLGAHQLGFSLARELRGVPGHETLPIGFVSADGAVKNRIEAIHAGASIFVSKPLALESFVGAVDRLLSTETRVRPRVLVVDDDRIFGAMIRDMLEPERIEVSSLTEPERIFDSLESFRPDLVLIDAVMPEISGFDVCRIVRGSPPWQNLPLLLTTARQDGRYRLAAFDSGADDYLVKPFVKPELLSRIRGRLERTRLLRERATIDSLTGLLLRREFSEQFEVRVAEARRCGQAVSICLLDLDRFKAVNDQHGHLAGDRVLAELGRQLRRAFRAEDLRARWGGEEFVIALAGAPAGEASAVVGRVLEEFHTRVFEGDRGETFTASFSGGIATFPNDGVTLEALLQVADRRLYEAKQAGRDRLRAA